MDYEKILQDFLQRYAGLERNAKIGSVEKNAYSQIVQWVEQRTTGVHRAESPKQRVFMAQIALTSLREAIDPPSVRPLVSEALKTLEREAQLPPLSDLNFRIG